MRYALLASLLFCACASGPLAQSTPVPAPSASPSPRVPVAESPAPAYLVKGAAAPLPTPPLPAAGADVTHEFDVPEGLKVTAWAVSPAFFNPTNIDIDERGRVWVAEAVNYRRKIRHSTPGDGYAFHEGGDRIVILEDRDGDGAAETSKVFVQDKDLVAPLGLALIGKRVFVSASPYVFVYEDKDGDDKADTRTVFLEGFGGKDHDHGAHAFSMGPDGLLYFNTGNEGPHDVKDKAGWTLRKNGDSARPDAPKSDDGRTWVMGVALRIGPDGKGMQVLAHNFRNNYELAVDAFGTLWQNDNDDDGNESCRFTYVMESGNYGYASALGHRRWNLDRRAGQSVQTAHWHQDDPGVVPPTEVTGSGAPTGLVVAEKTSLGLAPDGKPWDGIILNADAGRSTVFAHRVQHAGAGYSSSRSNFIRPKASMGDKGKWFRPSDVAVGIDGAVYVSDWYDPVVGGHNMLDGQVAGRILRISRNDSANVPPKVDLRTVAGQVEALGSPAAAVRAMAQEALAAQGGAVVDALVDAATKAASVSVKARLLWLLSRAPGGAAKTALADAQRDPQPDVRITALRAARQAAARHELTRADVLSRINIAARDQDAAVRREAALALRDMPWADAKAPLIAMAQKIDPEDRLAVEAMGIGAQGKEAALYAALAKGPSWSARLFALAYRLHPPAAVPRWAKLARDVHGTAVDRQRALVALAFSASTESVGALLDVAEASADPLQKYAEALVLRRAEAEWKELGQRERLNAFMQNARKDDDAKAIAPLLAALQDPATPADKRVTLVEQLATTPAGGRALVGMAAQKKLSPELKEAAEAKIFVNPDPGVRALASQHFARPAFEGVAFPSIPELVQMKGDATRGRAMFFSNEAACSACHEYAGQGRNVGPSLTKIGEKMGAEALFDSILNPSAGISFGYNPWVIVTKDGATYTGFIVADGDSVVLKDATATQRFIPAREIALREKQSQSLMPDNIALGMKPQDLVDLVAFLRSSARAP